MLTPLTLQDALNIFLEKEVAEKYLLKSIDLKTGEDILKKPQVIMGYIIPKSTSRAYDEAVEYPYICTRIMNIQGLQGKQEAIATMKIMFGAYCQGINREDAPLKDGTGYRDIWNMMETTRQRLFEQMIIDNRYRIIRDYLHAEMPEEQPYPYWEGFMITKWHVAYPQPNLQKL